MDIPPNTPPPSDIPPNEPPREYFRGRGGPGGPRRFGRKLLLFGSLGLNVIFLILIIIGSIRHHMMAKDHDGHGPGPGGPDGPRWRHHGGEGKDGDGDGGMSMESMEKMMMFMMLTKEMEHMQGPDGHPMPGMLGMRGMPGMGEMPPPPPGMPMPPDGGPMHGGMGGGREGHDPKEQLEKMLSNRLELTDDEKAKLKQLIDDEAKDFKTKLRAGLTPDQQKQLDALPNF